MTPTLTSQSDPPASPIIPVDFAGSPYRFKSADPYSSHSLILSVIGAGEGRRVLDVGAAHGYLAAVLQSRGFHVTGIEADPAMAKEAAQYCEKFFQADLDGPLPELADKFDVIIFGDVLEHLKDPLQVLVKLAAYLNTGGKIIISIPNVANLYMRLHLLTGKFDYQDCGLLDRTHLRFFTRKTFTRLLQDAGLKLQLLTATPIPLPLVVPRAMHGRILSFVHGVSAWVARHWQTVFAYQFIAVAYKDSR